MSKDKIVVGVFVNGSFSFSTVVTGEKPRKHNEFITSVYGRVRLEDRRLGTRFIPDINHESGVMYKALNYSNGELQPYYNHNVHRQMIGLTSE